MAELKRKFFEFVFIHFVPNSMFTGNGGLSDKVYIWIAARGIA